MANGTIRHWNDDKGYGFIRPADGGEDLFFHISSWQGRERPQEGTAVVFTRNRSEARPSAKNVYPPHNRRPWLARSRGKTGLSKFIGGVVNFAIVIALAVFGWRLWQDYQPHFTHVSGVGMVEVSNDPAISHTVYLIQHGGHFPYPRDGVVFDNRERRLPIKYSGYYHEYTVPTPFVSGRGARRIVTGGNPPEVYYYTADHYRTFRRLVIPQ